MPISVSIFRVRCLLNVCRRVSIFRVRCLRNADLCLSSGCGAHSMPICAHLCVYLRSAVPTQCRSVCVDVCLSSECGAHLCVYLRSAVPTQCRSVSIYVSIFRVLCPSLCLSSECCAHLCVYLQSAFSTCVDECRRVSTSVDVCLSSECCAYSMPICVYLSSECDAYSTCVDVCLSSECGAYAMPICVCLQSAVPTQCRSVPISVSIFGVLCLLNALNPKQPSQAKLSMSHV